MRHKTRLIWRRERVGWICAGVEDKLDWVTTKIITTHHNQHQHCLNLKWRLKTVWIFSWILSNIHSWQGARLFRATLVNNYFRNQWWRRKTGLVNFLFQSDSHQASSGEFVHWQDKGGRQKPNILCSSQNIYNLVSPDPAHMWLDNIVRMNELMRVENNSWSWHLETVWNNCFNLQLIMWPT